MVLTASAVDLDSINIETGIIANASTGNFAPYYIGSLNHGKTVQKASTLLDIKATKDFDNDRRIDWGAGAEVLTGWSSRNDYMRWDEAAQQFIDNPQGPAPIWIQQLYGEIKHRAVFLTAGLKEHSSALLSHTLSSGDLVESGNARPIPEVRAGFIDFVDIPFTQGWVQIQGEISYGYMADNTYMRNHYNYYNNHIAENSSWTYKRCYFRSNPNQPFSVTAGMQSGAFFGGNATYYSHGKVYRQREYKRNLGTYFEMIIPMIGGGEDFVKGSSLGSWDFHARYRLRNGDELCGYFQWLFEDGSGIGRRNHPDGLWGLEYRSKRKGIITGAVIEYIDLRDQSGSIHYSETDYPGTTIHPNVTGKDDYYNNAYYNAYTNYGMCIGTPFLLSPVYNLDGYPAFACTRANGFHAGVSGFVNDDISYRVLAGYQRGLGTYDNPYTSVRTDKSFMIEGIYHTPWLIDIKAQIAYDHGDLRGNNFGALLHISYHL